ncbi:MAG: hypothetical protein ACFB3T_08655 [Geminicoccaceae bacterium]
MLRALFCLFAGLLVMPVSPAAGDVLGDLGLAGEIVEPVTVEAWVTREGEAAELTVALTPNGDYKLVADPGIEVAPLPRDGVAFGQELPVRKTDAAVEYWQTPTFVSLPFTVRDSQPIRVQIDYAYCQVMSMCFFGAAELDVATAP